MADFTVVNAGEKLIVGQLDMSFLTASSLIYPGTAVINGPCFIGLTPQIGVARATCMIGPAVQVPGLPGLSIPASLEVTGIANFLGNTNTIGISQFLGLSMKLAADISAAIKVNSGAHISTQNKVITGNLNVTENVTATQYFGDISACSGKKNFDIPHPSKPGWRLRHVCIEGPTADVFVRGQLDNKNVIELPYYWKNLVDAETITVNLTPIEMHQELFVDKIEWGNKIYIKNNSGSAIKCYYTVYGERKDTSKNIPEYEGTYDDYPGDNREYVLSAIRS
jgi:hypothetical protein